MKLFFFLFIVEILVARCLQGGVTHELKFDFSINSCESPDSANVTVIVEGMVSLICLWQNHEIKLCTHRRLRPFRKSFKSGQIP